MDALAHALRQLAPLAQLAALALVGCGSASAPAPARSAETSAHSAEAAARPRLAFARAGLTTSFVSGSEFGRERYEDDGDTLVCHLDAHGTKAVERLSRSAHTVRIEQDGKSVVRAVPKGTVVLENLCWQQLAVAAEEHRDASTPTPVHVLVPGPGVTLDGTIQVDVAPKGDRYVTLVANNLRISADIGPEGAVERVRVPAQHAEARGHATSVPVPESEAADGVLAAAATSAAPSSPPPSQSLTEQTFTFERPDAVLHGTLALPKNGHGALPVLLIIAGSGPTDRDGNNAGGLKTDSYKQLAAALAQNGIASLRYDKRGVGESTIAGDGAKLVLADFTEDARALVGKLGTDPRFSSVSVLGHSEGGVIGLELAQTTPVKALVLLGTPGRPLAVVLREQLSSKISPEALQAFDRGIVAIRNGTAATDVPKELAPLLDPHVAAFLRSAMDVDPPTLVASAKTAHVAIVQGDMDMQVSVDDDARRLAAASPAPRTRLTVVPGMAHTLKGEKERTTPQPSYFDPKIPLAPRVVDAVVEAMAAPVK